ncbi:stage V sporulation protein D (sporulation-specific penicillin-binding protein) [Caldicoprobacter guelmensis]|uniref:stage V sporulation protein D n=1 Tax=Caldicoprobacter guelmensis TaxID=1170224 RepID=UPI001958A583|nr:stage V sporulation protein D (sporulation-specific penicillin-binding protein) [Caldicoprobacter guelmensis]
MALPGVTHRKRLVALLLIFTLIFFALTVRVGYIQLIWGIDLQKKAVDQWTRDLDVFPRRGVIKDRNGKVLAQSATSESIAARPSQISDPRRVASLIAPILGLDEDELYKKLSNTSSTYVWIKRQVDRETANKVRTLNIKGLDFTEEPKRYYPNGSLAAHVLGFTMKYAEPGEGLKGQEGIELYYDKYLKGFPGKIVMETDAAGREMPYNVDRYIPPINGLNLMLTIDQVIQYFTEREISNVVAKYNPKKVYAIVMDPNTGEILAMANWPTFDPNNPPRDIGNFEQMQQYIKNFACKENIDPGSTFKIITAAAALEEGVVSLRSTFNCPGYKIVDGQRINCWRAGGHGHETFPQAVQNSCNPVFMELALRLGKDKFYQYLERFGFGQPTGIDVLGEEKGIIMPKSAVKNVDLARMGFGQAISVTPLQLITAVSAVINGGNLMRPYIAKELRKVVVDEKGQEKEEVVKTVTPQKIRQVISPETSKIMREVLESVVTEGSGRNAYIPGYRVGGKTGTAQKYGPDGKIIPNKNISSFIGFAPADNPRVIALLMVDEPEAPVTFGSVIAAPYVKNILEDTLKYLGVEPVFDEEAQDKVQQVEVPDVIGMEVDQAVKALKEAGLEYLADEAGTVVKDQVPKPGAKVVSGTTVLLYTERKAEGQQQAQGAQTPAEGMVLVPDVRGKSIREANRILVSEGLKLRIEGSGIAIGQDPAPGTQVEPGTEVKVRFALPTQ